MLKYGFKDFIRNIYGNIFIALQLAAAFLIAVAAVSSVLSRTQLYTPLKPYIQNEKGVCICNIAENDISMVSYQLDQLEEVDSVFSSYSTSLYFSPSSPELENGLGDDRIHITAYPKEMAEMYIPQMESGNWLTKAGDSEYIPAVITANDKFGLGDIITVTHREIIGELSPDDVNYSYTDPYEYEWINDRVEIVGVVAEDSQILGFSDNVFYDAVSDLDADYDFRDLYTEAVKRDDMRIAILEDDARKTGANLYHCGNMIVGFKDSVSGERAEELELSLRDYGRVFSLDKLRKNSMVYISGQLAKLLPMLICVVVMVIVSSVSASALNVKSRLKDHSIYYVCGSKWSSCLMIGFVENVLTVVLASGAAAVLWKIFTLKGFFKSTVIIFGKYQLMVCVGIALLDIAAAIILPAVIMKRNTPKEILTSYE